MLGKYYSGKKIVSSHAEEHGRIGKGEPFDSFIRGWIGYGGKDTNGVIHFAPSIPKDNVKMFDDAFFTLEMFVRNGAAQNTIIRGFPGAWEQPLSNIINKPTLMERLEQKKQEAKAFSPSDKTRKSKHERG